MEERKSKSVHKSINKNFKKSIDETEYEEPLVTDNPVIDEPSYFNIFGCGKKLLNKLNTTCKRACMTTSREKYYTEMLKTLNDCNDRNNMPLSNAKIREEIHYII